MPGFKIHDVPADRAASQRKRGIVGLRQDRQADPEPSIGFFRASYGLKDEIDRGAEVDSLDRGCDMTQTAGLRRNIEALPDIVEQADDPHIVLQTIGRGVDADHRVADAEQESVKQAGRNPGGIVGRMVRLQPCGEAAGKPDRVAESCNDAAFGGDHDEVLRAHDLGHCGGHFRGEPGSQRSQMAGRCPRIE